MEYEKIKAWLDGLAVVYHKSKALVTFDEQISICNPFYSGIHIYEGIDILADVMGLELEETERDDEEFIYEYSFIYRGASFYQISEERLGVYAGAD